MTLETRRITYDFDGEAEDGPESGDVLRTARGRFRLVVSSRRVKSKVHRARFALGVVVVEAPDEGARVFTLAWKKRERRAR